MRILLAADYSIASDGAAAYLNALPFEQPVDLDVVSVIPPVPHSDIEHGYPTFATAELLMNERKQMESRMDELKAGFASREYRSVNCKIETGMPGREITAIASDSNTDLVVLGAVGHSALARLLLGSVSDYVATHTTSSAMVVRTNPSGQVMPPKRLLLALDCSEQDEQMASWLQRFDLPHSTEVHLVYVVRILTFFSQHVVERATEAWQQHHDAAERHARSLAEKIEHWGYTVTSTVMQAPHPGDALITYASEHDCDLIITGDHQRSTATRMLMGSTSRDVLRHAPCSVLISRIGSV